MFRYIPASLIFLVATGVVFLLQMVPFIGIFLMFMLAMFWSVMLVNAAMIGTAIEALIGRVSRLWLVLPLAFYGGYWFIAAQDHQALRTLGASYDAANARVVTQFDPDRHALVFDGDNADTALVHNYALPVVYSLDKGTPEGFRSHRMMESAVCAKVHETRALQASRIYAFGFHDGDRIGSRKLAKDFCGLSMPERPELPMVRVARLEEKVTEGSLPVTRATTIVTMPGGRTFRLLGGVAAPLRWFPMPVMGCALNSGGPSWDCDAGFWRKGFTPIVSGDTRYGRDSRVLAKALGLKPVAIADRKGGDATRVTEKIAVVERETLARQLAAIDAMVADPLMKDPEWDVGVVASRPDALVSRADAIMTGVERAAAVTGDQRYRARESGRILAGLLPPLPRDRFVGFGPRILALYARADDEHWLWEVEALIRRLGDLGPAALPHLVNRRASTRSVNGAGIEGLCRVGPVGRAAAEPVLLERWRKTKRFDRDERKALFVAMRRIGTKPPPLANDERNFHADLERDWGDVTPASPPRVCAVRAEQQARREEEYSGTRRTNLD